MRNGSYKTVKCRRKRQCNISWIEFCFYQIIAAVVVLCIGMIIGFMFAKAEFQVQMMQMSAAVAMQEHEAPEQDMAATEIATLEKAATKAATLENLGQFKLTAYCACKQCCGKTDGITKSGTIATEGRTIAVDASIIPLGTTVIIGGHEYIAEDIGGAIKGNRIDVFFDSHETALNFGVQYDNVYVESGVM